MGEPVLIHMLEPTENGYSRLLCDHSYQLSAYRITTAPDIYVTPSGQYFTPVLTLLSCTACRRIVRSRAP